ncbi:hypothetical protein Tco_1007859 [Tanacetum coccineum]
MDSLIMGDEHLDTIPETESNEFIKSSVENLVQNPSESEDECECDVPDCDDSQTTNFSTFSNPLFDDSTSSDDESSHEEVIHKMSFITYLNPLFDLEEEIISSEFNSIHNEDLNSMPKDVHFDADSYLPESLGVITILSDYSLPDYEVFYLDDDHIEEKSSGSTTTHANFSQYDSFIFKIEPELGNLTMDVVEDIFDNPIREPRVHVPNVLPTHPTLHLDSDFTLSSDSLGSDLVVSFPSETRNKISDPGIFIGVQSMRFLSLDEFSISFIRDLPFPVIDTFLPFSPQNEDKAVNPGILASNKEKSPHLLSHLGFNPSKIIFDFSESPMMIYGGDIPILDVPFLHFYPP